MQLVEFFLPIKGIVYLPSLLDTFQIQGNMKSGKSNLPVTNRRIIRLYRIPVQEKRKGGGEEKRSIRCEQIALNKEARKV